MQTAPLTPGTLLIFVYVISSQEAWVQEEEFSPGPNFFEVVLNNCPFPLWEHQAIGGALYSQLKRLIFLYVSKLIELDSEKSKYYCI